MPVALIRAANDNAGLGMWGNEFSGGTTFYFDQGKKWDASGVGFYEIHATKENLDSKTVDIFRLEGGAGRAFLHGYANARSAYAGQWKVRQRSRRQPPGPRQGGIHVYFGA